MNLQANFEIAKIQSAPGSLGQLRLNPSQQQRPATLATPSFNISGMQLVSGFDSAPLQLTPSHQTKTSVHLTAAFQITSVEFSPAFEIAGIILNSSIEDRCCAIARRKRFVRRKCTDVRNNERADGEQWRDRDAATESGSETRLTFPTKTKLGTARSNSARFLIFA